MLEHMLFHVVFLGQVILVSFVLPRKILARMTFVFETYPPETHPKLYPRPMEHYGSARRTYRILNLVVLVAGLLLLAVLLGYPRSGEWDHVIAMWYFLAQMVPVVLLDVSALRDARLMRNLTTTRKAGLQPRRVSDFISPVLVGLAICTYLAFVLLVLYVRQFEFPWFGGYWNIVILTMGNLFLAAVVSRQVYGRKLNPHQAIEDRLRSIGTVAHICVLMSIAATLFVGLHITLAAFDQRALQPAVQSLFFQLLAVISFRIYLVQYSNFDVYKSDSAPGDEERAPRPPAGLAKDTAL